MNYDLAGIPGFGTEYLGSSGAMVVVHSNGIIESHSMGMLALPLTLKWMVALWQG